ncbi:glycine-rich domain-containing protein [Sabulicella rubraurantiaca]|uniref:hypothetical protein n=1 Tax=Sabulicella rubraurantiaca TaxID=2811429 RepID=UPI001A96393C|nr:hypothetical protein [Sabulicella rubraurantiaca]
MPLDPATDRDALFAYRHPGILARFVREHGVAPERAEELFRDALAWLWLCRRFRERRAEGSLPADFALGMHPELLALDEMWHTMILFTRDYAALCERHLGGFVHHDPAPEGPRELPSDEAFAAEITTLYTFVAEELGEETLLRWFEERRHAQLHAA